MHKPNWLTRLKPLTLIAFIVIYAAVWFNWQWLWGLLLLLWLIPSLLSGTTYLAGSINRWESPVWYWLITGTWFWMSLYLILSSFI